MQIHSLLCWKSNGSDKMHDEEILFLRKPHVLVCDLWGGAASTELTSHGRNAKREFVVEPPHTLRGPEC